MDKGTAPSQAMVCKLMKFNGYEKRLTDYFDDYPLTIALPYLADKEEAARLKEKFSRPEDMKKIFQEVYAKHLTGDEVLDMISFFKTPAGQKFVEHDEQIRGELQAGVLKLATEIAIAMVKENIRNRGEKDDGEINLQLPEN